MRHRARSLHILALAPVAAILAGVLGPTSHALAAAAKPPAPIVVTVDAGHGGQPSPAHPNTPFDPGAIGTNGLLEKDVDLDVASRLAALLRTDLVDVVMTRTSDIHMTDARRRQISAAHRAALVVSLHGNVSTNPRTAGSIVIYPDASSLAFARTLEDALAAEIGQDGVPNGGVAEGDAAWLHNPVPAATVEMAYLSNPAEAALLATAAFRQDVAAGLRDGVEAYMPSIIARRDAILAWREAHHAGATPGSLAPASATIPGSGGFQFGPLIAWLAGIALAGAVLLWHDAVARVLVLFVALIIRAFGGVMWLRRAAIRRRRRRQRVHTVPAVAPVAARPSQRHGSVYDDIPL